MHLAGTQIELQVREPQHVGGFVAVPDPAKQSTEAREQLGERERLRQVVVRACVEPRHPTVDLGPGGEHEDRDGVVLGSQPSTHLEPVDPGHEDVEDHRVRRSRTAEPFERLLAVVRELDLVPLELERAPQRVAHGAFIVDDENLHRPHCEGIADTGPGVLATS